MAKSRTQGAAKNIATEIIDDPQYRQMLLLRARAGDLPPAMETMLWHYRFGKPAEHVILDLGDDLSDRTPDELNAELDSLKAELAALPQGAVH